MKKRKSRRRKGNEEARPFEGLSRVNQNAAGVDIGATEIVACVPDGDEVQLVKVFGNWRVAEGTRSRNGGDGKHRGVLDPTVRRTGASGI